MPEYGLLTGHEVPQDPTETCRACGSMVLRAAQVAGVEPGFDLDLPPPTSDGSAMSSVAVPPMISARLTPLQREARERARSQVAEVERLRQVIRDEVLESGGETLAAVIDNVIQNQDITVRRSRLLQIALDLRDRGEINIDYPSFVVSVTHH